MENAVSHAVLQRALDSYRLGNLKAARRPAHGFVNDNWIVETPQGRFFLKHRHPSLSRPAVVRAQHALKIWLRRRGFPAPALLRTAQGQTLLILEGECYEIQQYIDGTTYERGRDAHFVEAAGTLGRYHALVKGFRPPAMSRRGALYCPMILAANLARLSESWHLREDAELAAIGSELEQQAGRLAARFAERERLPAVVIHGDYYGDNLLFEGDRIVGVVDYDKACWQPRVVELAEALLYFASSQPGDLKRLVYRSFLDVPLCAHFVQAYGEHVALSASEARALPDYVRCIWLQVSLQRLWEQGPRPADAGEALCEVLTLDRWASDNMEQMAGICEAALERRGG